MATPIKEQRNPFSHMGWAKFRKGDRSKMRLDGTIDISVILLQCLRASSSGLPLSHVPIVYRYGDALLGRASPFFRGLTYIGEAMA